VAYATISSNNDKINMILRLLLGLNATDVNEVIIMPDVYGMGQEAAARFTKARQLPMDVEFLDMPIENSEVDSYMASSMMNDLGVGCIITLGGDGTNRVVAKTCEETPVLPISTGTNNVFPLKVEATVAGMAAGLVANGLLDPCDTLSQRKKLEIIRDDEVTDIALVDAVIMTASYIGARAVWDVGQVKQIIQTCSSLNDLGLSAIGGCVHYVDRLEENGLSVEIGNGIMSVAAPIGPGLIKEVQIKSVRRIRPDEKIPVQHLPSILALDGERHLKLKNGEKISIRLTGNGPRVVEVEKVLRLATQHGLFRK
jgi:predicted polyphosphate/ATP-dependent NAD kinase